MLEATWTPLTTTPGHPGLSRPAQHFKDLHGRRIQLRKVHGGTPIAAALLVVRPRTQQGPAHYIRRLGVPVLPLMVDDYRWL